MRKGKIFYRCGAFILSMALCFGAIPVAAAEATGMGKNNISGAPFAPVLYLEDKEGGLTGEETQDDGTESRENPPSSDDVYIEENGGSVTAPTDALSGQADDTNILPPAAVPPPATSAGDAALPQASPVEDGLADYGPYNAGDIAIINENIRQNKYISMAIWKEGQTTPPLDWSNIYWSDDESDKRIVKAFLGLKGLTSLNVTGLTELQHLYCGTNELAELDLSGLTKLVVLSCEKNKLTRLDLSEQPNLSSIDCKNNPIENIKLYGGWETNIEVVPAGSGTVSIENVSLLGERNTPVSEATDVSLRVTASYIGEYMFSHWTSSKSGSLEISNNPWSLYNSNKLSPVSLKANFVVAPDPVISIDAQPAALTKLIENNISGSLSTKASVSPRGTLAYQWYYSNEASNLNGEPINGANSPNFLLPRDLKAGNYYYHCLVTCLGAEPVKTEVAHINIEQNSGTIIESSVSSFQQLKAAVEAAATDGSETQIEITENIDFEEELLIGSGTKIKLWSSSQFVLKALDNTRLFTVCGSLILENNLILEGTGAVNGDINGGGIYVNKGNFTMNGGTIRGCVIKPLSGTGCGTVYADGLFTMNGGEITGNSAKNGSGVYVTADGQFFMNGGSISDNNGAISTTLSVGGAVFVNSGYFEMNGGEISRNNANETGGVYNNGGTFILNNGLLLENIKAAVVIRPNYDSITNSYLSLGRFVMNGGEINGNNIGAGVNILDECRFDMNNGKIINSKNCGVYFGGKQFIMKNGEISGNSAKTLGGGVDISKGSFIMEGGLISNNTTSYSGGGVNVAHDCDFTITGGEISGNTSYSAGGGISMGAVKTLYIKGGTISNNFAPVGGGIAAYSIKMENGVVSGNTAGDMGGGINCYIFEMSGGEISGNKVTEDQSTGGGIHLPARSVFTMSGGEIKNNKATGRVSDGGGVYIGTSVSGGQGEFYYWGGKFNMSGGSISNNSATLGGGGVYLWGGEAEISNGEFYGNYAERSGGAIYVWQNELTIKNCTISENIAGKGGGGICVYDGTLMLENGTITKNEASFGGGVAVGDGFRIVYSGKPMYGSYLVMSGGLLSENTATELGGGLYVRDSYSGNVSGNEDPWLCAALTDISAGELIGNSANIQGDNMYVNSGTVNMSDGQMYAHVDNKASVYIADGSFNLSGGLLLACCADSGQTLSALGNTFNMTGGVLTLWDCSSPNKTYVNGSYTGLASEPSCDSAVWGKKDEANGIYYKNGGSAGFYPLDVQLGEYSAFTISLPAGYTGYDVYIDSIKHTGSSLDGRVFVSTLEKNAKTATMYKYDNNGVPVGMYVWLLSNENGIYTAIPVPELEDLLSYHGFSIRITGKTGIRFKTGISTQTRTSLTSSAGLAGFKLKEYGTLVMTGANMAQYPFIKGGNKVGSGMAYGKNSNGSHMDAIFETVSGRHRFTSVLIGLPPAQYKTEFMFRGYIELRKDGEDLILYGPPVGKNIYSMALQLLESGRYPNGSAVNDFLKKIVQEAV